MYKSIHILLKEERGREGETERAWEWGRRAGGGRDSERDSEREKDRERDREKKRGRETERKKDDKLLKNNTKYINISQYISIYI